jgi:hypothetical protein
MAEQKTDITPELWRDISRIFREKVKNDRSLRSLYDKIAAGRATYQDAQVFAIKIGGHSGAALEEVLKANRLPGGKLYWNIAQGTVGRSARRDYDLIADATEQIQTALNADAGLGLKAVRPQYEAERVESLMNRIVSADSVDDVKWALRDPITHLCQSVVDDFVRGNADQQSRAGMRPQIIRTAEAGACEWCQALAGIYDYKDVKDRGNDVYKRHNNCRCTVTYIPRAGTYSLMSRYGHSFQG